MSKKNRLRLDERGMVSFLVTLIMLAVITLIVVGFTQVARRNSREALDRQLSSQAFYAAESGLNVTRDQVQAAMIAGSPLNAKTTCANNFDGSSITPLGPGVQYTCVLVDPNPTSLVYNDVTRQNSVIIPIEATTNFTSLNFNWTKLSGVATGNCNGQAETYYPSASSWSCGFGILRLDIMQLTNPAAPPTDSNQMYNVTDTLYLSPWGAHTGAVSGVGGALPFGTPVKAYTGTGCDATPGSPCAGAATCNNNCAVNFNVSGARKYYVRATMFYKDAGQLVVTGKVAGGATASFINAQTMVDVTGKAQDELRRIQVRLVPNANSGGNNGLPLNALTGTAGVCKRFTSMSGDPSAVPASLCI